MNNTSIETRVALHQQSIEALTASTTQLVKATQSNGEKLDTLMISMAKQESILEKIASLEDSIETKNKIVHKRLDKCDDDCMKRVDSLKEEFREYKLRGENEGCEALKMLRKDVESNKANTDSILTTRNTIIMFVFTAIGAGLLQLLHIGGK